MKSFSEEELFALYWLQYFIVPMYESALVSLWRMRPGAVPNGDENLPLDGLVEAGLVRRFPTVLGTELTLVRSAFAADEFRKVLKSVEKHDWRFSTRKLLESWVEQAFPAASERRLSLWSGHCASGMEILRAAQLLHVFVRWGLPAMECFAGSRHFDRNAVYIEDMHGNDVADDAKVRKALRDAVKDEYHMKERIARSELKDDLTYQYETFYSTHLSFECCKMLMRLAERSEDALRSGTVVCGKQEEAVLQALLAARDFRRGEDVGCCVHRLADLSRQTVLFESIANLVFSLVFWRGEREVIVELTETLFHHLASPDYGRVLRTALDGDLATAAKRLAGAVGLSTMTGSDINAIDLPLLLTLLVIWTKAKNNRTAVKRLERYIGGVYRAYVDDTDAKEEQEWIEGLIACATCGRWTGTKEMFAKTVSPGVCSWLRTSLALSGAASTFARFQRNGSDELEVVSRELDAGYLTMAADAVAEIRGATSVSSTAGRDTAMADKIAKLGAVAVIGPRTHLAPWEKALDAIETTVFGDRKDIPESEMVTQGRIAWCWHVYSGPAEAVVDLVGAVYIGVRKDGGERTPVRISEAKLLSAA